MFGLMWYSLHYDNQGLVDRLTESKHIWSSECLFPEIGENTIEVLGDEDNWDNNVLIQPLWRFPKVYISICFDGQEGIYLFVRKWMMEIPLPEDIKRLTDEFLETTWSSNGRNFNNMGLLKIEIGDCKNYRDPDDFLSRVAWDIYRYKSHQPCLEYFWEHDEEPWQEPVQVFVVEEILQKEFWAALKKSERESNLVRFTPVANREHYYVTVGEPVYLIDTILMTCSCGVLDNNYEGLQCPHLIAALKHEGAWDKYWQPYIPQAEAAEDN